MDDETLRKKRKAIAGHSHLPNTHNTIVSSPPPLFNVNHHHRQGQNHNKPRGPFLSPPPIPRSSGGLSISWDVSLTLSAGVCVFMWGVVERNRLPCAWVYFYPKSPITLIRPRHFIAVFFKWKRQWNIDKTRKVSNRFSSSPFKCHHHH